MEKITYTQFIKAMEDHGKDHNNNEDFRDAITGVIVFKSENWRDKEYSEESRSYRVSSYNHCFQRGKISNSMYGDCLDGTDQGIRLDLYNWIPEYCYLD